MSSLHPGCLLHPPGLHPATQAQAEGSGRVGRRSPGPSARCKASALTVNQPAGSGAVFTSLPSFGGGRLQFQMQADASSHIVLALLKKKIKRKEK